MARLCTLLFATTALAAAPAWAQTPAPDATDTAQPAPTEVAQIDPASEELIVVTGSRIRSVNLESAVPVTALTTEDILSTGSVSIGDTLNDLPALRSTFSQGNSTRFIGTAGLNVLDLRGLGTERTLVLVDGRRHVPSSIGDSEVDTNTIPADLVERIDIVTGGASAIYGSDAIAGVVNFVLKRNFDGVLARGQAGISDERDRGTQSISLTVGKNLGVDDRGNVAVSFEYANADELRIPQRSEDFGTFNGRAQFNLRENTADDIGGSDGIPDREFFYGVRSINLSEGGTFTTTCPTPAVAARCLPNGQPRVFRFRDGGALTEADYGAIDFRPFGSGNQLFGDGSTLRRYGDLQPGLQRYIGNLVARYELSDAFQPFIEAKFVRVEADQEGSPTFQQGGSTTSTAFGANSAGVPIRFDNAFLSPQALATVRAALPATATFFRLNRNNLDIGIRGEDITRETYRVVGGLEGDFNDDWHYEISANWGRLDVETFNLNNRIQQRFELGADAVRNAAGQIVCRSQITAPAPLPEIVNGVPNPTNIAKNAALAGDIAACVPINLFGDGAVSEAARNYVNARTRFEGYHEQFVAQGFVTGDLSQLFELPGGPIGFALGAEYRRETAYSTFDTLVSSGQTFLNAIPEFDPDPFEVK